ncbi:DcrB-related protein [Pseudomonas sp. PS02290]|jgi:hypothetical protein|uniref:DcrB-related protein n=1 Tax=Pseudomonas sp. PS02290 TaxID=2991430 RepID=UPI00249B9DC2|nr:DcrB-related protein [Pseudomonas sp. PS02290]
MDYQIQEGRFALPEGFQDRSVNIFALNGSGPASLSITISRDDTLPGEDISAYLERQLKLMASKLRGYTVLDKKSAALNADQPLHGLQISAYHIVEKRPIHQRQAAFIIAPARVLVFSATSQLDFTTAQNAQWNELLASFVLNSPTLEQE